MFGVVWDAYHAQTGGWPDPVTDRYPPIGAGWDDEDLLRRRLPHLAALFLR